MLEYNSSILVNFIEDFINDTLKYDTVPNLVDDVVHRMRLEKKVEKTKPFKTIGVYNDHVTTNARKVINSVDSKYQNNDHEKYNYCRN